MYKIISKYEQSTHWIHVASKRVIRYVQECSASAQKCWWYFTLILECCKCARRRFHCANALVVLRMRICAPSREHWLLISFETWPTGLPYPVGLHNQRGGIEWSNSWIYLVLRTCPYATDKESLWWKVETEEACLQTTLVWHYPFLSRSFAPLMIYIIMIWWPSSKIFAHTTELGPAKAAASNRAPCLLRPALLPVDQFINAWRVGCCEGTEVI